MYVYLPTNGSSVTARGVRLGVPPQVLEADAPVVVALVHDLGGRQDLDAHRLDAARGFEHERVPASAMRLH